MKKILLTIALVLTFGNTAWAENTLLFKDFYYGMPAKEVMSMAGAVPCVDPSMIGHLCNPEYISFAGYKWEQDFLMDNESLSAVMLVTPFDDVIFQTLTQQTIPQNGYSLLLITTPNDIVDVVQLVKTKKREEASTELARVQNAAQGEITFSYFENSKIQPIIKQNQPSSASELLKQLKVGTRSVEIDCQNGFISLMFLAPFDALQDAMNRAKIDDKF